MTIYLNVNEQIALIVAFVLLLSAAVYTAVVMFAAYKARTLYVQYKNPPNWLRLLHIALCLWPAVAIGKILFG